jgi:Domain of unknown function (DUF4280)
MSEIVVNGASIECAMGKPGKATLVVLPASLVSDSDQPIATIMDNKPMANIPTFGMCTTQSNPAVAAATAAALGTPTPAPCVPVVPAPWAPGSATVMVGNKPALTSNSSCMCQWGGKISISNAGQTKTTTG